MTDAGVAARLRAATLRFVRRLVRRTLRPDPALKLERIGSTYGGWIVPTAIIRADWICYLGGVGEDITFDLGLIERFGVMAYAFDPTPRAIAHVNAVASAEPRFSFMPVGLWSEDTSMRFFAPKDPAHVSHSVVNLQRTDEYFEAQCRSLASIKAELGHDRVDLVKLDIEGSEHRVIASMLAAQIRPTVLCTEIDQPVSPWRFWRTIRRVEGAGYALVAMDNWNFTFVRRDAMASVANAAQ